MLPPCLRINAEIGDDCELGNYAEVKNSRIADGVKISIWTVELDTNSWCATPGQVLVRGPDDVTIACGGGTALRILRASIDGSEVAPRKAFGTIRLRL